MIDVAGGGKEMPLSGQRGKSKIKGQKANLEI